MLQLRATFLKYHFKSIDINQPSRFKPQTQVPILIKLSILDATKRALIFILDNCQVQQIPILFLSTNSSYVPAGTKIFQLDSNKIFHQSTSGHNHCPNSPYSWNITTTKSKNSASVSPPQPWLWGVLYPNVTMHYIGIRIQGTIQGTTFLFLIRGYKVPNYLSLQHSSTTEIHMYGIYKISDQLILSWLSTV